MVKQNKNIFPSIALLRSKGGKANRYDENGREVEPGNGDLNE
jgi:hypothetical protein